MTPADFDEGRNLSRYAGWFSFSIRSVFAKRLIHDVVENDLVRLVSPAL
jgi:hypothetical protein